MAFLDFILGSKPKMSRISTMSSGQEQVQAQILGLLNQLGGAQGGVPSAIELFKRMLDPASNQDFEDRYRQQYEQEVEPMLAERYAGAGALSSSGFGQALGAGRSSLESNLANLASARQMQGASGLTNLYSGLLGQHQGAQPFAYLQQPPSAGFLPSLLGMGAKSYFGGF
jgi:hypothetical protein